MRREPATAKTDPWIRFATLALVIAGAFTIIAGLVALLRDNYYLTNNGRLLVWNYNAWGGVHLGLGILLVITGLAVGAGATWARVVAVIIAALNALAQLTFIGAAPVWAMLVIGLDVLVIYAVTVHLTENRALYG